MNAVPGELNVMRRTSIKLFLLGFMLLLGNCAYAADRETEPVPKDSPEREKYGEFYDLKKYAECKKKNERDSSCDRYKLVRVESPEYWPNPDVPKPRWPDAPKESVYKHGMDGVEYWRALCKAEAGDFVYKTVDNVSSVFQIRPRPELPGIDGTDKYVLEDPYGYGGGDQGWLAFRHFIDRTDGPRDIAKPWFKYLAFERPILPNEIPTYDKNKWHPSMLAKPSQDAKYQFYYRLFADTEGSKWRLGFTVEYSDKVRSRYGFTWRQIDRPHDRELGVKGGELMIVDLQTGEVLGLRRGFILAGRSRLDGRIVWLTPNACPEYSLQKGYRGYNKDFDSTLWFLYKVLKPRVAAVYEKGT
jgi:hypothetical protein